MGAWYLPVEGGGVVVVVGRNLIINVKYYILHVYKYTLIFEVGERFYKVQTSSRK